MTGFDPKNNIYNDTQSIDSKIGETSDLYPNSSVFSRLHGLLDHIHSKSEVYPNNADSVLITGGAGAWQHGAITEIVPASTITEPFDIHFVITSQTSGTDEYQLQLYSGAIGEEVLIASSKFYRDNTTRSTQYGIQTELQDANTRISASLASSGGGADTTRVSIYYHTY